MKPEPLYVRAARLKRLGLSLTEIAKLLYGKPDRHRAWALIRYARKKGLSTVPQDFLRMDAENGKEMELDTGFEPRSTLWSHHADPAERIAAGEDRQLVEHERLLFEIYRLAGLQKHDQSMVIWISMKSTLYRTFPRFKALMNSKVWFHATQASYPAQNLAYLYLVVLSSLIWTPLRWQLDEVVRIFSFFLKRKHFVDFMQWRERLIPIFVNEFAPFRYVEVG